MKASIFLQYLRVGCCSYGCELMCGYRFVNLSCVHVDMPLGIGWLVYFAARCNQDMSPKQKKTQRIEVDEPFSGGVACGQQGCVHEFHTGNCRFIGKILGQKPYDVSMILGIAR